MSAGSATLAGLPLDIGRIIFNHLDVHSLCRLFIAYSPLPYANEIFLSIEERRVEVTAEYVVTSDPSRIDFKTLAQLPLVDVLVDCPASYAVPTFEYLREIPFKLLALTLRNNGLYLSPQPDLTFLCSKLTKLSLQDYTVISKFIPETIKSLELKGCGSHGFLDFKGFKHLEEVVVEFCKLKQGLEVSLLITKIHYDVITGSARLVVSSLSNAKYIMDHITNVPVPQISPNSAVELDIHRLETSITQIIPKHNDSTMVQLIVDESHLESILGKVHRDQMTAFRDINGKYPQYRGIFQFLKVLHCQLLIPLTQYILWPPNLQELSINTNQPVKYLPPQLEIFRCFFELTTASAVNIDSSCLIQLEVRHYLELTINCPSLVHIDLASTRGIIVDVDAPNLETLNYSCHKPFPFQRGFPKLTRVHILHLLQDVVFHHHMESVEVSRMNPKRLSFSADFVGIYDCNVPNHVNIESRVVKCNSSLIGVRGIKCQELECQKIDKVPETVEKCSLVLSKRPIHGTNGKPVIPELLACTRLKSLRICGGLQGYGHQFPVPSTVSHLIIKPKIAEMFVETSNTLKYFECEKDMNRQRLQFNQKPYWVIINKEWDSYHSESK